MPTVNTVTGPIDAERLGRVLPHERIFLVDEDYRLNFLPDWDEEAQVARAVARLREVRALGVDTIFDVSVFGTGRKVDRVARVARESGVNVVAATGVFTYNDLPFQFHYTGPALGFSGPDPLDELFVRDLTEGIGNTGIRAAFLVCVIEAEGPTAGVERILRATGRAAVATGAPIMVATNPHTQSGLVAQQILASEGVDLTRVMLAHCGDTTDLDYLIRLADAGSILGLDRFGVDLLQPYEQRLRVLEALLERGLAGQLALSQGAFCTSDWFDEERLAAELPDWNYLQVYGRVLPDLRARGVDESIIAAMTVDLPRRFLTGERRNPGLVTPISPISGFSTETGA
ncbi:phosphotriesterase [Gordonia sp. VNK21]|uniref:phosphotriesterase family protein n=1 Tax=Gordonia sp. VNK21 TaxID=3382483 RepID=UPI0038D46140